MRETPASVLASAGCRVIFGGRAAGVDIMDGRPVLRIALPVLSGKSDEYMLGEAAEPLSGEHFTSFREGPLLAGFAVAGADADLEAAAGDLYRRLFEVTAGLHLYRVWNYVPHINAHEHGLENYQRFCRGRSLAFENHFGRAFRRHLPAASAVGAADGQLVVGFLAGNIEPHHFENPRQIPAFEYPSEYGPRPPSFSRATCVQLPRGRKIFISGTAAIRGHATVAVDDLDRQLACAVENLRLIGEAAGAGAVLGGPAGWRRSFKIYIRHPSDLGRIKTSLERDVLRPADTVSFLQADICRADLLLEIEAVLAEAP
jgi:chorismate lyase/3-hydroxybenzoate synthase